MSYDPLESKRRKYWDRTIRLDNGDTVGYAWLGETTEYLETVVFIHGTPGSRLDAGMLAPSAKRMRVRILAFDRAGMGSSSFVERRTIVKEAERLADLILDFFGLRRFYILGYSNGTSYALALSGIIPPRKLRGVGIVAGLPPWSIAKKYMEESKRHITDHVVRYGGLLSMLADPTIGRAARAKGSTLWRTGASYAFGRRGADQHRLFKIPGMAEVFVSAKRAAWRNPAGLVRDV